MLRAGTSCLRAIQKRGVVGIVSIGDIVKAQHDHLTMENHYLKTYIQGEVEAVPAEAVMVRPRASLRMLAAWAPLRTSVDIQ